MNLSADWRERVERYVRPLYTELDGADTFVQVERLERQLDQLSDGVDCDRQLLTLLVMFQGVLARLGSLAPGSRWQLFVRGLGLEAAEVASLRGGLERLESSPQRIEEALLHDALLLKRTGVRAAVSRLLAAGKKRTPVDRAVDALDPGPSEERFRTPGGARLGGQRHRVAEAWIATLRAILEDES